MSLLFRSYETGVISENTFAAVAFVADAEKYQSGKGRVSPEEAMRRAMILWARAMRGGIVIG